MACSNPCAFLCRSSIRNHGYAPVSRTAIRIVVEGEPNHVHGRRYSHQARVFFPGLHHHVVGPSPSRWPPHVGLDLAPPWKWPLGLFDLSWPPFLMPRGFVGPPRLFGPTQASLEVSPPPVWLNWANDMGWVGWFWGARNSVGTPKDRPQNGI